MERPHDLFDRETEWSDLLGALTQPGEGTRLALMWGRRRQGKSYLLRRACQATGGYYHQALDHQREPALEAFGADLGTHLGVPGGRLAFSNWNEAIGALADLPSHGAEPAVVVIDELPYLLHHSPELPSVLQRHIDGSRTGGRPLRLVLCGSALAVMASLLSGTQALRGRATYDLVLRPFNYRTAAAFWGIEDPATAFIVNAVVGGTPGYRDLLPAAPPQQVADVERWLAQGVLNPISALFREDDYLLAEERSLTDRGLYHAVVGTIAAGKTSQGAIASALGRENRAVQHPLRTLEQTGFVTRTEDAMRDRRPIYGITDPIVRFHHVITRPDLARYEERRTAEAWSEARHQFATHILGPHFEEVAREFTFRFAAPETTGGPVARVAPATVNDPRDRRQHQLDVVATSRRGDSGVQVLAIGEAKHTTKIRKTADMTRLERIRELLISQGQAAADTRLLLFSATGFDEKLTQIAADRTDIELIDFDRLYHGR